MLEDGLLALNQPDFSEVMERCRAIESRINEAAGGIANRSD